MFLNLVPFTHFDFVKKIKIGVLIPEQQTLIKRCKTRACFWDRKCKRGFQWTCKYTGDKLCVSIIYLPLGLSTGIVMNLRCFDSQNVHFSNNIRSYLWENTSFGNLQPHNDGGGTKMVIF